MFSPLRASNRAIFVGLCLMVAITAPVFVWGGSKTKTIYVDKDNTKGTQDGSKDHPYRKIGTALDHAKGKTVIYVGKGQYKENIRLPKDTKLVGGKDKSDVVIVGDNDKPTITMKEDTEINKITVKGGRHGVRVEENAEARIIQSIIKDSARDGVHIDRGTLAKKDQVFIEKTDIKGSKMAGIFSEKRHVIVMDCEITRNADGIDFTSGVKAWFQDNFINDNRGSGAKFVLDGSSIWSKNNQFRRNGREGIEVNAYGAAGSVGLKKAKIADNKHYGITRVARTPAGAKTFGNLFLENIWNQGNAIGNVSPIFLLK